MSKNYKITAEFEPMETIAVDLSAEAELEVDVIDAVEAMKVGIRPAVYRGESGKAPMIGEDGYWYVWNSSTEEWENTGVYGQGGTTDYEAMQNKPRINDVELSGNKTAQQLGLENRIANSDIEALFAEE